MLKKIPKWLKITLFFALIIFAYVAYHDWHYAIRKKQAQLFNMLTYDDKEKVYKEILFKIPLIGYQLTTDNTSNSYFNLYALYPSLTQLTPFYDPKDDVFIRVENNSPNYKNTCLFKLENIQQKKDLYEVTDTQKYLKYANDYYVYKNHACLIVDNFIAGDTLHSYRILTENNNLDVTFQMDANIVKNFPEGIPEESARIHAFLNQFIVSQKTLKDKQDFKPIYTIVNKD
jgi:hypothetical protein